MAAFERNLIGVTRKERRMIDISHILVLSDPNFLQRCLSRVLGTGRPR